MDIKNNQVIHSYLIENKDFLDALENEFAENEIKEIIKYSKDLSSKYPEVMDQFYDWINDLDGDIDVLSIGWDSDSWGPGGNGFIRFELVFGLVKMTSSDYESEYVEIFDKEKFSPWAIENLMNDYIEISSDIYADQDLLEIAKRMGTNDNTKLTINGKEIEGLK